jgi:hypothetical protein
MSFKALPGNGMRVFNSLKAREVRVLEADGLGIESQFLNCVSLGMSPSSCKPQFPRL